MNMKRMKKTFVCFIMMFTLMLPASVALADTNFYTYNYDIYDVQLESPDAYTAEDLLLGTELGIGDFLNPTGLFVRGENVFIVDSGNNRIVEVTKDFKLVRVIDKVMLDGAESTLKNPKDVFVDTNGDLYICDTDNYRILHTDKDLKVIKTYTKPEDKTITKDQNFTPKKCVVDNTGRLYLMAEGVNKGFMSFDSDGTFAGYIGANKVKVSFYEVIQKRLMTKAQRQRMELFVPTEYSNLSIDEDNFLYATTNTFKNHELFSGVAAPIRKLNSLGSDILVKNGYEYPVGELWYGTGGDVSGPSRFEDVTSLDNDCYFVIDRVRGRVFGYDFQGNLLYAFGGLGNKFGYFQYAVAIEHLGTDLLVLDNRAGSVTRFTLTEYGALINNGLKEYKAGHYDESAKYWEEVLHLNGNYNLAYIGIGRALLRQEKYNDAMKYFKAKRDFNNYSKAFQEYRKEWVEVNIGYIVAGLLALIILPKLIRFIRKIVKGEVFK